MILFYPETKGQDDNAIHVNTLQELNFGTIIVGHNGGTVTVYPDGSRSRTGDVILTNSGQQGSEAVFELKSPPSRLITILLGKTNLTNGTHSMKLDLGPVDPVSPFLSSKHEANRNYIHVGGTLIVGNSRQNPEGTYKGSFTINFFYE